MLELFQGTLNRLSQNSENINLNNAIKSWCQEADINYNYTKTCLDDLWKEQSVVQLITEVYKKLLIVTNRKLPKFMTIFGEFYIEDLSGKLRPIASDTNKEISKMNIKLVLMVALALTGIGFIVYQTQQKQKQANQARTPRQPDPNRSRDSQSTPSPNLTPSATSATQTKTFLFLVLKTYKVSEDIINKLNNDGITPDIIDQAFSIPAIEALWQGPETDYRYNRLDQSLQTSQVTNPSQSDVYLVEVELDQPHNEFKSGSDSMIRYKAFRRMIGTKPEKIKVSKRLAVKDYNAAVLYR